MMRWLFLCVLLVGGCTATGPRFAERHPELTDSSLIYLYRPKPSVNILMTNIYSYMHVVEIYLGDELLGKLKANSHLPVELPPGKHQLRIVEATTGLPLDTLEVETATGDIFYARYSYQFAPVGDSPWHIKVVPTPMGQSEIRATRRAKHGRPS